jgi:hypothetical protein
MRSARKDLETTIIGLQKDLDLSNRKVRALRKDLIIWEKAGARLQELMLDANKAIQAPTRVTLDGE